MQTSTLWGSPDRSHYIYRSTTLTHLDLYTPFTPYIFIPTERSRVLHATIYLLLKLLLRYLYLQLKYPLQNSSLALVSHLALAKRHHASPLPYPFLNTTNQAQDRGVRPIDARALPDSVKLYHVPRCRLQMEAHPSDLDVFKSAYGSGRLVTTSNEITQLRSASPLFAKMFKDRSEGHRAIGCIDRKPASSKDPARPRQK